MTQFFMKPKRYRYQANLMKLKTAIQLKNTILISYWKVSYLKASFFLGEGYDSWSIGPWSDGAAPDVSELAENPVHGPWQECTVAAAHRARQ